MEPPADSPVLLTRILHPCVLASRDRASVLIDPCFGSFLGRSVLSRLFGVSMPRPGLSPDALPALSLIALTHGHEDHFDAAAIGSLPSRDIPAVTGDAAAARGLRRMGFRQVERLGLWQSARGEGWEITAVPARSPNAPSEVSFVLRLGDVSIFHGGDTATHGEFAAIRRRCAPQVACLPVNGVSLLGLRLTMTPAEAASAARELGVRVAIPIHDEMDFGGLSRLLYRTAGTARAFEEQIRALAPGVRVARPRRGEPFSLSRLLDGAAGSG